MCDFVDSSSTDYTVWKKFSWAHLILTSWIVYMQKKLSNRKRIHTPCYEIMAVSMVIKSDNLIGGTDSKRWNDTIIEM